MGMAADRGRDTFIKIKLYQLFTGRNSVKLVQQLKSRFIIWRDELHFRLSPQQRRMFISQLIANLCHHIRMGGIHINYNGLTGRYRNRDHPIVILPEYVSFTKASGKDIRIQPDSDFQSRTRRFLMKPFIRLMPFYFHIIRLTVRKGGIRHAAKYLFTQNHCYLLPEASQAFLSFFSKKIIKLCKRQPFRRL